MKPLSNKKLLDEECRFKKQELRKISNQKHRDPLNANFREQYHHLYFNRIQKATE